MDISFFLAQYLQFRYLACSELELYIVDQVHEKRFEIIIRDNGDKIDSDGIEKADQIIASLHLDPQYKNHQYFHKGYNHLQIELMVTENVKPRLGNFYSLLSVLILENPATKFVFSYISPKGEYVLDSANIHQNFSKQELQSKELLAYVNELLKEHFEDIQYTF